MRHFEDQEQAALFQWAAYYPELRWMHSIPNGGSRNVREARRLVQQGVRSGVFDVFLPVPVAQWCGLYIEMKRRRADGPSKVTPNQADFMIAMTDRGYKCVVCYGFTEATAEIKQYLDAKQIARRVACGNTEPAAGGSKK